MGRLLSTVGMIVLTAVAFTGTYLLGLRAGDSQVPDELEPVIAAYERIQTDAVEPPDTEVLVEGAIEGMLEPLEDQYAEYYLPEEYSAVSRRLDGTFVGIGVVLEPSETGLVIQSVLPSSPAEAAELQSGDRIVEVEGEDVSDEPTELIVQRLRGEAGTMVQLGVRGEDGGPTRAVEVTREELRLPFVESRMLEGDLGYVRLLEFANDTVEEVAVALESEQQQGARGFVLDLRGNPGGLVDAAVDLVDLFVEEGREVVSVGDDPDGATELATRDGVRFDEPLVVLVDESSASASEIVAAAIQDLGRGQVVGETTFGKGSVQTIRPLGDESALKLTTDRYYTPEDRVIQNVGVTPDIAVAAEPDAEVDPVLQRGEQVLRSLVAESQESAG